MHDDWEGGQRQRVAWRRLIVAMAVAGLAAATWLALQSEQGLQVQTDRNPIAEASDEPDVVLQPPVRAGSGWVCPSDHPVRAFDAGVYYPPEHPAVPADATRPEGCFLSPEWAESGGYDLAPTPPDVIEVGSLYLVPTTAPTAAACADVAAVVGFPVPCPERLPAPGRGSSCANTCLFYGDSQQPGVVIEQRGFPLPLEWCDACQPHVVITAVRDRAPAELISCGPRMARDVRAGERITGFHDCGPGPEWLPAIAGYPHERHTLLVDEAGPITFAVSMEGHGAQVRAVVSNLRRHLVGVAPR